jgi:hypothetical protein
VIYCFIIYFKRKPFQALKFWPVTSHLLKYNLFYCIQCGAQHSKQFEINFSQN